MQLKRLLLPHNLVFSLIPVIMVVSMFVVHLSLFNEMRFLQCSPWSLLPSPKVKEVTLLGQFQNNLYIKSSDEQVYCLQENQWVKCDQPSSRFKKVNVPEWLIGKHALEGVSQLIRIGDFLKASYYKLFNNGQIYACSTTYVSEIKNFVFSVYIIWSIVMTVGEIWFIVQFAKILIREIYPK